MIVVCLSAKYLYYNWFLGILMIEEETTEKKTATD